MSALGEGPQAKPGDRRGANGASRGPHGRSIANARAEAAK